MRVIPLDRHRRTAIDRFWDLSADLYRDSPQWCPGWRPAQRLLLDHRRHPFYEHSEAEFFVAEDGVRIVGRIAAIHNRHYQEYHGRPTGFFGYFDAVPEEAVVNALVNAAAAWLRDRGLTEMVGPYGLLRLDGGGVLVEGFEHPAAMGIAYNHPDHDRLLHAAGLQKYTDYLSGRLDWGDHLPPRLRALSEKIQQRHGFSVQSFRTATDLQRWVPQLAAAYETSFKDHLDYYPRTPAERDWIRSEMLRVADPRLIKLILHDNTVAGFLFAFPDLRDGLRRSQGRLWPWGWYHLARARHRPDWCDITHMGLLPQFRRRGATLLLYAELEATLYAHGYRHVEVPLVEEGNTLSRADLEAVGVRWYKRHRIYRGTLTENGLRSVDGETVPHMREKEPIPSRPEPVNARGNR